MWLSGRSDPLQIDTLQVPGVAGRLGLTHCPGRKLRMGGLRWDRNLEIDLDAIRDWGASALLTLNEEHELSMLGVSTLGELARARFDWIWLPIPDGDVPDAEFDRRWTVEGARLRDRLVAGEGIVVHCLAGLGRSGTIAARLLIEFGMSPPEAIRRVREVRIGAIETAWQERYVLGLVPPVR
jgi:ADP-ribosyl-[dinitrogen reductase] hydrolase